MAGILHSCGDRRYPFTLVPGGADDQFIVCIDEASSLVSETEGSALFDIAGMPTVGDRQREAVSLQLQQMEVSTHAF